LSTIRAISATMASMWVDTRGSMSGGSTPNRCMSRL
jgi:hypothetical protein